MQRTQPQYLDLEAYLADDETRAAASHVTVEPAAGRSLTTVCRPWSMNQ